MVHLLVTGLVMEVNVMVNDLIEKYGFRYAQGTLKPNYILIPVNRLEPTIDNANIFNEFFNEIKNDKEMFKIKRTPSGGISKKNLLFPAYDVIPKFTDKGKLKSVEITILTNRMCRIQFANKPHTVMSGTRAFRKFKEICEKFGIDFSDYEVSKEEGQLIKEDIKKPLIGLVHPLFANTLFEHVHHIDYHSSFPTGLINTHSEFKEAITYMYNKRHEHPEYKEILNLSIGYMQSEYNNYKYAGLSRDAINDNDRRIKDLSRKIESRCNRMVISYNTDGIWYIGPLYHDLDEGTTLGTWQNDHIDCTFRAKSDGAYEFIENNKYHAVVRGSTLLDRIKPRDEWEWGDIYQPNCTPYIIRFDEEKGILYEQKN